MFLVGQIRKLRASNFMSFFFFFRPPHHINCIACFIFKLNGSIWKQNLHKSKPTCAFPKCRLSFRLWYFFTNQLAGKWPNVLNSYALTLDIITSERDKSVIKNKMCETSMCPNKGFSMKDNQHFSTGAPQNFSLCQLL